MKNIDELNKKIISCRKCGRLVEWREKIAREKVRRFSGESYWGKPVTGLGDRRARLLIVGLAPAAHGANRTGRMFTGDKSGEYLYRALHKAGFANQAHSISRVDGLKLSDCYITAVLRCAPPLNKPAGSEIEHCRSYLLEELDILKNVRVILGLGKIGFDHAYAALTLKRYPRLDKKPRFSHGALYRITNDVLLAGSYHPSQQNTFTGKLTEKMFDDIFLRIKKLIRPI